MYYTDFRPILTQPAGGPAAPGPNSYSALLAIGPVASFMVSWLAAVPSTVECSVNSDRLSSPFGLLLANRCRGRLLEGGLTLTAWMPWPTRSSRLQTFRRGEDGLTRSCRA